MQQSSRVPEMVVVPQSKPQVVVVGFSQTWLPNFPRSAFLSGRVVAKWRLDWYSCRRKLNALVERLNGVDSSFSFLMMFFVVVVVIPAGSTRQNLAKLFF